MLHPSNTRPTVGAKRCGMDQRARAIQQAAPHYSRLITHKKPPSKVAQILEDLEAVLAIYALPEEYLLLGDLGRFYLEKGESYLMEHKGEAITLLEVGRLIQSIKDKGKKENKKRSRKNKKATREVVVQERRKPLTHKPFSTVIR